MINSQNVLNVYNQHAKLYDKMMNQLKYAKTLKNLVESLPINIPSGGKILELGCGTGIATGILIKKFPNSEIIGFDYSDEMLKICHERYPNLKLVRGNFNEKEDFDSFITTLDDKIVSFPDSSFDFIFSTGAVSEYGQLEKVIPIIYNLIKRDSQFINIGIKRNLIGLIMGRCWNFDPPGENKFIEECKKAGFSDTTLIPINWRVFPTSYVKYVVKAVK